MQRPKLEDMANRDSLSAWYTQPWTIDYVYQGTPEDISYFKDAECKTVDFVNADTFAWEQPTVLKSIPTNQLKQWMSLKLTDTYKGTWLIMPLTKPQQDFFAQHGRIALQPTEKFYQGDMRPGLISPKVDYTKELSVLPVQYNFTEEWARVLQRIWGHPTELFRRYPYNTVYITTDMLLHVYHKLFENSLIAYEEKTLRPQFAQVSIQLADHYLDLLNKASSPDEKHIYGYLASYRAIEASLLPSQEDIFAQIDKQKSTNPEFNDLTDEQINALIQEQATKNFSKLPENYKKAATESIQLILAAKEMKYPDPLFALIMPTPPEPMEIIKQDYTQFTPRSHYTNDSLLKTYFMGAKWLMREKMYVADAKGAATALIMAHTIPADQLVILENMNDAIKRLIWSDDDMTITLLQKFLKDKNLSSPQAIISASADEKFRDELLALFQQKIISTSYQTAERRALTEDKAHLLTNGLVMFGEKFTVDSRLFDKFTAWSAETESSDKPDVQTALIVADNLLELPVAERYVELWMNKHADEYDIRTEHIKAYPNLKSSTRPQLAAFVEALSGTIYHRWLGMLATVFTPTYQNIPYFLEDALYQTKQLVTYLGSYTELKHDTLLYVKQAYAELWGWGGTCSIEVIPPDLPIAKGYVEPNIDLMNNLLTLTQDTDEFFHNPLLSKFSDYITFVKGIALKQANNEKISDEEFEQLRLSDQKLNELTIPEKVIGLPIEKEQRWSLIADIFTSGLKWPLYEATGRPHLLVLMIDDANGKRVVTWPIFSHYEFYGTPVPIEKWRYTDEERQAAYDPSSDGSTPGAGASKEIMSLPFVDLMIK